MVRPRANAVPTLLLGLLAGLMLLAAAGCPGYLPPEVSDESLIRVMESIPGPLTKMNDQPLRSIAAPGQDIDLWVSDGALGKYAQIRPDASGSNVQLPVNTTVLRAIRDASGTITKYTALVKREPGFNPPSDLWFAVYDAAGQLTSDASGAPMAGPIPACTTCHLSRANDGYVFGAPE